MTLVITSSLMGTAGNLSLSPAIDSFRNFVKIFRDSIVQAGWVDTNASGSVDTGSVVPIGQDVRVAGYSVFRMNDTLHGAGYPVFIRVDYGNATFQDVNTVAFTVGFSHNGSGSIGGVGNSLGLNNTGNSAMFSSGMAPTSGALYDHRFCIVSGGDMGFILANNHTDSATFGFVERTKDANGNSTPEGIVVGQFNRRSSVYRQSYLMYSQTGSGQFPRPETYQTIIHSGLALSKTADTISVGMFVPIVSYGPHYPCRMFGYVKSSDLPTNITTPITIYNTSSIYFVSDNTSFSNNAIFGGRTGNTFRLIMRNE